MLKEGGTREVLANLTVEDMCGKYDMKETKGQSLQLEVNNL